MQRCTRALAIGGTDHLRNGSAIHGLQKPSTNGVAEDKQELTPKQRRFVAEYIANPNATQAYLRAFPGSTYHTARNAGAKLLAEYCIREEIDAAREALEERSMVEATEVVTAAARIMRADPIDLFDYTDDGEQVLRPMRDIPAHVRRTLSSVKVKRVAKRKVEDGKATTFETAEIVDFKFNDRMAAIEVLMKYLGVIDRVQPQPPVELEAVKERLRQYGIDPDQLSSGRRTEARTLTA